MPWSERVDELFIRFYRDFQVKTGVVRVLSELSASYKEKNQLYCAITLCNLAYPYGYEMTLIEEGGFSVLMMIALVSQLKLLVVFA